MIGYESPFPWGRVVFSTPLSSGWHGQQTEPWLAYLDGGQGDGLQAVLLEQHVGEERTLEAVALDLGPLDSHVKQEEGWAAASHI